MFNFITKKKTIQPPAVQKLSENYDIVIHIGAPKTGSSAIQKYLLENRKKLLEFGFYYPEHKLDENGISGGHSDLGRNLKNGDFATAKKIMQTYINEAKRRNSTLLISAESLFIRADGLKELVGTHRCKIIAFFRDPLEKLYSSYNQGIKRNYLTMRLEQHCQNLLGRQSDPLTGKIFEHWEGIFGKSHLMIRDYDTEKFAQTPIQSVFLEIIGIDIATQKKHFTFDSQFVNNSYCLSALELKRMFNFVLNQQENKLNNEIDCFLQGYSDKEKSTKYILAERISKETYTQLYNKFSPSTSNIRKNYLQELNHENSKAYKPPELKSINQHQLNIEMMGILNQLNIQKPKLYLYIQEQLEDQLGKSSHTYELIKLAEMFNHDINKLKEPNQSVSSNQLKEVTFKSLVEFYRDIAGLCYDRGDLESAQLLIQKAIELRPNGLGIIKLANLIENAKNTK